MHWANHPGSIHHARSRQERTVHAGLDRDRSLVGSFGRGALRGFGHGLPYSVCALEEAHG
jgi:hypothetical protein